MWAWPSVSAPWRAPSLSPHVTWNEPPPWWLWGAAGWCFQIKNSWKVQIDDEPDSLNFGLLITSPGIKELNQSSQNQMHKSTHTHKTALKSQWDSHSSSSPSPPSPWSLPPPPPPSVLSAWWPVSHFFFPSADLLTDFTAQCVVQVHGHSINWLFYSLFSIFMPVWMDVRRLLNI